MSTTAFPRHPSFSANTNSDSSSSTPTPSQHSSSDSEPSTAATSAATSPERGYKATDEFIAVTDPLGAAIARHGDQRREDVENATRITHATPGPTGPLGLTVGHAEEVGSRLSTQAATLTIPVDQHHTQATLGIERNAISVSGTTNVAGGTMNAGVTNVAGFINANASFTSTAGASVGGLVGGTTTGLAGAGVSTLQMLTPSLGLSASLIGLYQPDAKTEVKTVDDKSARIERQKSSVVGAQTTLSIGMPQIGVATRSFGSSTVVRQQEVDVTPRQAKEALKDNGFFRRRMIGMGFSSPFTTRDAIATPSTLASGEQALERRSNATAHSAALAGAGVQFGAHRMGVSDSQVSLKRSNSGSKSSLKVNKSESKTKGYSLDVPVFASLARSTGSTTAAKVQLEIDQDNNPADYIQRSPAMLGLSENFDLPLNIDFSSFAEVNDPKQAIGMIRQTETDPGVSIKKIEVSQRDESTQTRGSIMPLTRTLFGPLAGNAYEKNSADIRQLVADPMSARFISGREQTTRKEIMGLGTNERTYSFLQVNMMELRGEPTSSNVSVHGESTSVVVAKNTFEQCSVSGLNLLGKWTRSYIGGPELVSKNTLSLNVPRFSASVSIQVRLETEDKIKLYKDNFFSRVSTGKPIDNAAQQAELIPTLDEEITAMLKYGDSALHKLMTALNAPERIAVDIEVDLVDDITKRTNELLAKSQSPLPETSGMSAAFKRRVMQVSELFHQAQRLKRVYDHPAVSVDSTQSKKGRNRLLSLQKQVLKLVGAADGAELDNLLRRISHGNVRPVPAPASVGTPTHREAAQALAMPVTDEPEGDIDLGTLSLRTVSQN